LGVAGNDDDGEREGTLQTDSVSEGSGASMRLAFGETNAVESEEERIEASTPQVASRETEYLHSDDSAAD